MPKLNAIQTNWTSGEVSPLMQGRVDTTKYQNGASSVLNLIVRPQGPVCRRTGTAVAGTVFDSTQKTRIQRFRFNQTQAYVIEFGNLTIRIWFNGGIVTTTPTSGIPIVLTGPWTSTDLSKLKFTQSGDILYVAHPNYQTQQVERLGANSWAITPYVAFDGPYLSDFNTDQSITAIVSAVATSATATATTSIFSTSGSPKTVTAIAASSASFSGHHPIQLTVTGHGLTTGNVAYITGIVLTSALVDPNNPTYSGNGSWNVQVVDANNFWLYNTQFQGSPAIYSVTSAQLQPAPGSGNYVAYRQTNQWLLAQIVSITSGTVAQVKPIPYIKQLPNTTTLAYSSPTLTASNSGVFTLDDLGYFVMDPVSGNWYQITAYTDDSHVTATAISTLSYTYPNTLVTLTPTVSMAAVTTSSAVFASTDVGRHIRFNFGGKQPWGIITMYGSSTSVQISLQEPIPIDTRNSNISISILYNNGITSDWKLGAWSNTSGWPAVACFHQQRLWFGFTNTEPENMWSSQTSDFTNMATTDYDSVVTDNCALTYTLVSNEANDILWMESGPVLLVGTIGAEWQVAAANSVESAITPTNIFVMPQTNYGSIGTTGAARLGTAVVFTNRCGNKLIELTYSFQLNQYVGRNLNIIGEHILRQGGGILYTDYQQEPHGIVWACLNDGTIASMTYELDQQIVAWHRHILGGNTTQPLVESLCTVPSQDGTYDVLYMVVNRQVNGTTTRFIEYLTPDYYPNSPQDKTNMWFMDCAARYQGSATTTISGLSYLNGEQVSVVADGSYLPSTFTVSGGQISLSVAASNVLVGYNFTSTLAQLPIDGGSPFGTAVGKVKKVTRMCIRLYNTLGYSYGSDLTKMIEKSFFGTNSVMNVSPNIKSGDDIVTVPMEYGTTGVFYLQQNKPYPLTVLCVAPDVEVHQ